LTLRDVPPLVPDFLASSERELDLGTTVLEVEPRRHERQAALRDLARERGELLLVQEQLAVPVRVVVRQVPLVVDRDVGTDEPGLPAANVRIGLLERGAAVAKRFHLGPRQDNSRL